MTTDKISEIFGVRLTKKLKGKLQTTLERMQEGQHVFRAYCKNAFVKQYQKHSLFLRQEVCSNNLADFKLKKGLDSLPQAVDKLADITDRFASFQAECLNVDFDFPLLQKLALPIVIGTSKYPGIKIHDTRMIRRMEVLLHAGTQLRGDRIHELHQKILETFKLTQEQYSLNQLRYDLRKLRGHGLLEREQNRYTYRLSHNGLKVAILFALFHKRICGPLANSLFNQHSQSNSKLSRLHSAYKKAEISINNLFAEFKMTA